MGLPKKSDESDVRKSISDVGQQVCKVLCCFYQKLPPFTENSFSGYSFNQHHHATFRIRVALFLDQAFNSNETYLIALKGCRDATQNIKDITEEMKVDYELRFTKLY